MKKSLMMFAVMVVLGSLSACKYDLVSQNDKTKILQSAAQVGQQQTILQIMQQAKAKPCEPINLFNQVDKDNRIEVNLVNIECPKISGGGAPGGQVQAEMEKPVEEANMVPAAVSNTSK